jgi:4-amino-4-deoxy-L-arabinose transferase-like glycosyltransferase
MSLALERRLATVAIADLSQANDAESARLSQAKRRDWKVAILLLTILSIGAFLRIYPSATYPKLGSDEVDYVVYLKQIEKAGAANYGQIVRFYVQRQYERPDAIVPATRVGFLLPAYWTGKIFQLSPVSALHATACAGGILLLGIGAIWSYRLGGTWRMLAMSSLLATSALQIYLSQRALLDDYFAFFAVLAAWLAWENLQRPRHSGWLLAYSVCLAILVLTKENGAFVIFALAGMFALNRYLKIGVVTPQLIIATIAGPLLAILLLAAMIGGLGEFVRFYLMFESKSRTNWYSVAVQDGPWFRYLIDFILLAPLTTVFALGGIFQLRRSERSDVFMATFLGLSFLCMAPLRYGLSLRYAVYWEIPICWLACSQISTLRAKVSLRWREAVVAILIIILSYVGIHQYHRIFVAGGIYDPVTYHLARASRLLKSNAAVPRQLEKEKDSHPSR